MSKLIMFVLLSFERQIQVFHNKTTTLCLVPTLPTGEIHIKEVEYSDDELTTNNEDFDSTKSLSSGSFEESPSQ